MQKLRIEKPVFITCFYKQAILNFQFIYRFYIKESRQICRGTPFFYRLKFPVLSGNNISKAVERIKPGAVKEIRKVFTRVLYL